MDEFLKKTECIIGQYGNYTAEEINVQLNGINTQGENIADNGGIKEAYRAYSKHFELKHSGLVVTRKRHFLN
jgi:predicted metalloendopeptidase